MMYKNFIYFCEEDIEHNEVRKLSHHVQEIGSKKSYKIEHSPYSYPNEEKIETFIDKILKERTLEVIQAQTSLRHSYPIQQ